MEVRYIKNRAINKKKWNDVLLKSDNANIYATSWYLDIVSENWDAIICEDYKIIMPIVWKQKFLLKYIYQPTFCQQLGVFSADNNAQVAVFFQKALKIIKKRFVKINMNINNFFDFVSLEKKTNIVLDLNQEYTQIKRKYKRSQKYSLPKAAKNNLQIVEISADNFIHFKIENQKTPLVKSNLITLKKIIIKSLENKSSKVYGVKTENKLVSVAFFAFYKETYYYLNGVNSDLGKKLYSSHYLFDYFIKKHANTKMKLDFEGSNIPGIASYFKGWGGSNVPYYMFSDSKKDKLAV